MKTLDIIKEKGNEKLLLMGSPNFTTSALDKTAIWRSRLVWALGNEIQFGIYPPIDEDFHVEKKDFEARSRKIAERDRL